MSDTFRKEYKKLSDEQVAQMNAVKDAAERVEGLLNGALDPIEP